MLDYRVYGFVAILAVGGCQHGDSDGRMQDNCSSELAGAWARECEAVRRGWIQSSKVPPAQDEEVVLLRQDGSFDMTHTMWGMLCPQMNRLRYEDDTAENEYYRYEVAWCCYAPKQSSLVVKVASKHAW